jgi:hypothetical protein
MEEIKNYVFFRVDDIAEYTDNLIVLTNIFINNKINASYQVIPNLLNKETIDYLNSNYVSNYIKDIGQHGYRHVMWGKGEFCKQRNYLEQKQDMEAGRKIIEENFKEQWHRIFSAPWNHYNLDTIKVLEELEYNILSAYVNSTALGAIFYKVFRFLNVHQAFGKIISNHGIVKNNLYELSETIDFNQSYENNTFKTVEQLMREFLVAKTRMKCVGFLLHPNHISEIKNFEVINELISRLKSYSDIKIINMNEVLQNVIN